jgi:ATP diphosphatase
MSIGHPKTFEQSLHHANATPDVPRDLMKPSKDIRDLLAIMAKLRAPETGCPWDVEQNFATIAPYTIEEAYEVADAIERGDFDDLRDELGDLLLQVVFHAQMAAEIGHFAFGDVVESITAKMIRRHPHVFGDLDARDAAAVKRRWEEIKAEEKSARRARLGQNGESAAARGLLGDVPVALPGLTRAVKLQRRAGSVGFDWNEPRAVLAKIREEIDEIEHELSAAPRDNGRLEDELGDILFAVANLARHLAVEPETALRRTNAKFVKRFAHIESELRRRGRALHEASLDEMEALWQAAKQQEGDALT